MELDEFEDDFADEDFIAALDEVSSSSNRMNHGTSASIHKSNTHTSADRQAKDSCNIGSIELQEAHLFPSQESILTVSSPLADVNASNQVARSAFRRSASGSFRQTTLWGKPTGDESIGYQDIASNRAYRVDRAREELSQHALDVEAMQTWVYPTNLGAIRDYQYSIVKNSLFSNTLVALPTGLGKTFIAATVMLNFYRWTKSAKIIFVAPTKPLVAQQVDACYNIVGIPRSDTTLLTGAIAPALRVDEWGKRRVFFMTPQTLLNDLSHGYADPKSITLIVIDEAHRATGEYAYAKVAKMIRRFSNSFRVLALTATPGSRIETVQEVIDNLGISHCEIRTEESIDIRQYVHGRNIDKVVLDPSDEMNLVSELFSEALKPLLEKLSAQNIWYGRSPMAITAYGLMQTQKEWLASRGRNANPGLQGMMRAIFSVLTSIAHSIKLLTFHGIKPFYDNMVDFRSEQEEKGAKGSKYKRQLIEHAKFQEMMSKMTSWFKTEGFVGHPKLTALADCVLNHFMDRGESSATRVIVFSEFRDSAEDIVRHLNAHRPLVKASIFVGQADGKRGEGMKQTQQIQTIDDFRKGVFNVLVATSIGEEGLDIGQVDLIVCYDASASPIRMLQRMGRTGRKRAGQIVLLLMRGKEEDQFAKSKDNYEKMQKLICEGSRFNFRFDLSTRIVPRDIQPKVDKRHVDIPVENTQDPSLPEPRKRGAAPVKKKPPKKFHMPDDVETGFLKVTDLLKKTSSSRPEKPGNPELDDLIDIPDLKSVLLSDQELKDLDRTYRDLPFNHSVVEETDMPSMTSFPKFQRTLSRTVHFPHGRYTKRCVAMLNIIGTHPEKLVRPCRDRDISDYLEIPVREFGASDGETDSEAGPSIPMTRKRTFSKTELMESITNPEKKQAKRTSTSTAVSTRTTTFCDDGKENDEENIGLTRRLPLNKKKARLAKKSKELNIDELGDDCERDSDMQNSSGSDEGSDLVDFIVSDDRVISSSQGSQMTSLTSTSETTSMSKDAKPFFVPTVFSATQESDGIPPVDALLAPSKPVTTARIIDEDSDNNLPLGRRNRGTRTFVEESDDE